MDLPFCFFHHLLHGGSFVVKHYFRCISPKGFEKKHTRAIFLIWNSLVYSGRSGQVIIQRRGETFRVYLLPWATISKYSQNAKVITTARAAKRDPCAARWPEGPRECHASSVALCATYHMNPPFPIPTQSFIQSAKVCKPDKSGLTGSRAVAEDCCSPGSPYILLTRKAIRQT